MDIYSNLCDLSLPSTPLSTFISSVSAWFSKYCGNFLHATTDAWSCSNMKCIKYSYHYWESILTWGIDFTQISENSDIISVLSSPVSLALSSITVITVQSTISNLKQQHTLYICTASGTKSPIIQSLVGNILTQSMVWLFYLILLWQG